MAFIPSKAKKHRTITSEELNLTSMMDAMTIILLFLLKTYSTTGAIISPSKDLKLPYSLSTEAPHKELTVSVTRENILVSDERVMALEEVDPNVPIISVLYSELSRRAREAKQNEVQYAIPFTREVIVVADENIPFQLLFKVIYTCGSSEYNKLRLLTIREK
ncbi:MAG: biopolymer transporter ExbD [Calditrichaeota bacterium]|nr:biopolymer transporter ExbD [Calditrichota bacterium]MCB9088725.1 biopolymer transporter ExbD [Calditrichia bacterium]MCB0288830.1 biopolymer transporter ExbD [Calditrichota bacterium]MCB0294036.1 biopolymer transporter ExbD [Calditrichota bacterium]MCB0302481.1 biopolymer transporter ExbD [Calditrichota bacterium]